LRTAAVGGFCCRNRHTDAAGGLEHFLKRSIVNRWMLRATYARLYLQRLRSTQRGDWRWPGDQLGKPAKVLRNRGPRELELGTAWSAQSQPAEPQDTLQMRKQHLDTFPVAA
jgi:hypothetical protein